MHLALLASQFLCNFNKNPEAAGLTGQSVCGDLSRALAKSSVVFQCASSIFSFNSLSASSLDMSYK